MRIILLLVFVGMSCLLMLTLVTPAHAGCEIVNCSTECWWVGPHTRRCQRRCLRRCWNDAPRYYAPEPQQRYHAPEPHYQGGPPFDPGAVVAVGLAVLVVAAILAAIAGSSGDATSRQIEAIEQQTREYRQETAAHDDTIHNIRAYKSDLLDEAERQGRRDADEEWQRRITRG